MKTYAILIALAGLQLAAGAGWGQDSLNVASIGRMQIGESRLVGLSGDYAYIANGYTGLRIVDISDKNSPREVGLLNTNGYAWGVVISGNYAYVADMEAGLRVVEISDPSHPREVGSFDTPGYAVGVTVSGGFVYIADREEGLRIIDVGDPTNPQEAGSLDTPGLAYNVVVSGRYAYVADWNCGLRIIDISNVVRPREIGIYDTPGLAFGVAINENYVYVSDHSYGLRVINVSDPSRPVETGFFGIDSEIFCVSFSNDFVYVAAGHYGLSIIDVSNPYRPFETGFYRINGAIGIAVAGRYAYVTSMNFLILDCSQAQRLRCIDFNIPLQRGWSMFSSVCQPSIPYIPTVFSDIVERQNLYLVKDVAGRFYRPGLLNNMLPYDVRQGYMAKLNDADTLVIVNVPVEVDTPIPVREGWNIVAYFPEDALRERVALASLGDNLIFVKDVAGRFYAREIDFSNMERFERGNGYQLKVREADTLAYPVGGQMMMSDVNADADVRHFRPVERTGTNMSLVLYATERIQYTDEFEVGVFNMQMSLCAGAVALTGEGPWGMAVWGDDPTTPEVDGMFNGEALKFKIWDGEREWQLPPESVRWIEGEGIYTTDGFAIASIVGLGVSTELQDLPEVFTLGEPYPNPFNARTIVNFGLPTVTEVKGALFDVKGRRVMTLVEERMEAGYGTIEVDGTGLAGGVYIIRLEAGGRVEQRKAVIIK